METRIPIQIFPTIQLLLLLKTYNCIFSTSKPEVLKGKHSSEQIQNQTDSRGKDLLFSNISQIRPKFFLLLHDGILEHGSTSRSANSTTVITLILDCHIQSRGWTAKSCLLSELECCAVEHVTA